MNRAVPGPRHCPRSPEVLLPCRGHRAPARLAQPVDVRHDREDDVEGAVVTALAQARDDAVVQPMMSLQFDPAG
jgi:hypothetical protein